MVKRRGPGAHPAHRGRRRDEHLFSFLLYYLEQRVEVVEPLLREGHRLLQPLIRGRDRRMHLLYIGPH